MNYESLVAAVGQLVDRAGEGALRSFAATTVARIVRAEAQPGYVDSAALTGDARVALADACRTVSTAGPVELRAYLARVDRGVRTDGDMDFALVNLLEALQRWTSFLETGGRDEVRVLAGHERARRELAV